MNSQKKVVAVTGASGAIYAKVLLDTLVHLEKTVENVAIVMSEVAKEVWKLELGNTSYLDYPFKIYHHSDFYAPFASGSNSYGTMIVCPCTMGALGRIAHGVADDLIARAADVMLKERRKLILVARETPLSLIHLDNMRTITMAGGLVLPATPSFYSNPQTIEEVVKTVTDRVLQHAGYSTSGYRWGD